MQRTTGLLLFSGTIVVLSLAYSNCSPKHQYGSNTANSIDTGALLQSLQSSALLILDNKCASCHNSSATDNNLKNVADVNYLTSNSYIDPGSPQTSVLYLRLIDNLMPPSGSPDISAEDQAVLRDWIAALGGNFSTYIGSVDGAPTGGGGGATGTFTQVTMILQQRCLNCHSGQRPPNLNVPYAQLVTIVTSAGTPLVVPGDANSSRLYTAVVANFMPQGNPLTNSQKETIRTWIASGAPNN